MLELLLAAGLAQFIFIALKAFQQLNVMNYKYWWVPPTSMLMSIFEVFVIAMIARTSEDWYLIIFPVGVGGGLGCIFSMWLHKVLMNRRKEKGGGRGGEKEEEEV